MSPREIVGGSCIARTCSGVGRRDVNRYMGSVSTGNVGKLWSNGVIELTQRVYTEIDSRKEPCRFF